MHLILIDNKSTLFRIQNEVKYTLLPEITSGFVYPVSKSEREKAFQVKPQIPIQPIHIFENNHPTPKAFAHWSYYMGKKTFAHQKSLLVPDDQVGLFSNLAMVLWPLPITFTRKSNETEISKSLINAIEKNHFSDGLKTSKYNGTVCVFIMRYLCGFISRASVEHHLDRPLEVPNIVVTLCSNDTDFYVR